MYADKPFVRVKGVFDMIHMNRKRKYVILFVVYICLFSKVYAAETISGKITAAGNGQVIVEIADPSKGRAYPVRGDKVTFLVEITGLDEQIPSGNGVVANVDGKTIVVTKTDKSPPLEAIVKILATGTYQPQTVKATPSRATQQIPVKERDGESLQSKAENGDINAMIALGKSLMYQNWKLSLFWLEKAERTGSVEAKAALADLLARGSGNKDDPFQIERATSLYREAAERGNAYAMYHYGHNLFEGYGVKRASPREALKWIEKSLSKQKNADFEKAYQKLKSREVRVGRYGFFVPPDFQISRKLNRVDLERSTSQKYQNVQISFTVSEAKEFGGNGEKYIKKVSRKILKYYKQVYRSQGITFSGTPVFNNNNGEILVTAIQSFPPYNGSRLPIMHTIYLDLENRKIYNFIIISMKDLYDANYWHKYIYNSLQLFN